MKACFFCTSLFNRWGYSSSSESSSKRYFYSTKCHIAGGVKMQGHCSPAGKDRRRQRCRRQWHQYVSWGGFHLVYTTLVPTYNRTVLINLMVFFRDQLNLPPSKACSLLRMLNWNLITWFDYSQHYVFRQNNNYCISDMIYFTKKPTLSETPYSIFNYMRASLKWFFFSFFKHLTPLDIFHRPGSLLTWYISK